MTAHTAPTPMVTEGPTDRCTTPSGHGFRRAGDPSLLLAASDGHPAVLIVVDVEGDAVNIRSVGVDPVTIPGFLQRLGLLAGREG